MLNNNVFWRTPLNQKSLIYDKGLGYPVYKNTVVFHSTPEPWGVHQSILHGLDTETGKEKWRLTNADFYPKKDMQFNNYLYPYQKDNIVIGCDFVVKNPNAERYIYAIDIEKGNVLWVKEFPHEYNVLGDMIRGMGKFAYVNAFNDNKFSLLKIDIQSGELSTGIVLTNNDLPTTISECNPTFFNCFFTDIYQNSLGEDIVACSINSLSTTNKDGLMLTLYIYNLTQQKKIYSFPVVLKGNSNGNIYYHNGKILIGKDTEVYCFDAFEDKGGSIWHHSVVLNDGVGLGSGNDQIMQVLAYDNIALPFCVDRLCAFDINTGNLVYNVLANGSSSAAIIDGILYDQDHNDFLMRDPKTGKELKRISTGKNEEGFSSSRPNGADGKIYVHTYTDAYCIKAWGK
jgi:outer membrane protein assembly factor BamB